MRAVGAMYLKSATSGFSAALSTSIPITRALTQSAIHGLDMLRMTGTEPIHSMQGMQRNKAEI
jgi:hypothetical protein